MQQQDPPQSQPQQQLGLTLPSGKTTQSFWPLVVKGRTNSRTKSRDSSRNSPRDTSIRPGWMGNSISRRRTPWGGGLGVCAHEPFGRSFQPAGPLHLRVRPHLLERGLHGVVGLLPDLGVEFR